MSESSDELCALEIDFIRLQIIQYLQQCLIRCKTQKQAQKALKKLNKFLETLPQKKRLNKSVVD